MTKFVINGYRSIKRLEYNNVDDINILIGKNESGKSNILKALYYINSNEKLDETDFYEYEKENEQPIISLYFKIYEKNSLLSNTYEIFNKIIDKSEIKEFISHIDIDDFIIKYEKYWDGKYKVIFIANESVFNITEKDNEVIKLLIASILKNISINNKNIAQRLFDLYIKSSKNNDNFNIIEDTFNLKQQIASIFNNSSYYTNYINEINSLKGNMVKENISYYILKTILISQIPEFIFFDQEMMLNGNVKKINTWKNTFSGTNKDYFINTRLFELLEIDYNILEKNLHKMIAILGTKLNKFSESFNNYWSQYNIKIKVVPQETAISFIIEDYWKNKKFSTGTETIPENRSRGMQWYLAYYITLEYLKKKGNVILLLDDPAVFLHERGQKDFVKKLNELSNDIQIFYTTHLVSLFDPDKLYQVKLVERSKEEGTTINRPWKSDRAPIEPVYHTLGFDKIIIENKRNVIFVEGISDKFIFDGFKKYIEKLKDYYIVPLNGGDKVEDNEIMKKIEKAHCLATLNDINAIIILDADKIKMKKSRVQNNNKSENNHVEENTDAIDENSTDIIDKNKIYIYIGNAGEELEDVINIELYADAIFERYKLLFIEDSKKLEKLRKTCEEIMNLKGPKVVKKIKNKLESKFKDDNFVFSKAEVAIELRKRLDRSLDGFEKLKEYLEKVPEGLEK